MKFKITKTVSKDRYDLVPVIRLYVWETIDYGIDSDEGWCPINIDFSSHESARSYAAAYAANVSSEEFTV